MCGRFVLITDLAVIARDFDIPLPSVNFMPSRNVSPGQHIPVVIGSERGNLLACCLWGLIPFWAKDLSIGSKFINARAETVAQKTSFKNAFIQRRCLIPADGFYEWRKDGKKKIPYCFVMKSGSMFYFAGLYEKWVVPDKKQVDSCTIITTSANTLVLAVHDRMPVIVPKVAQELWLNPEVKDSSKLLHILKPYPAEEMSCKKADFSEYASQR
jgi:putative SOS response-associated peptidase YedK